MKKQRFIQDNIRGNVIVEFAIVLPLLMLLVGGTIDWSGAALSGHILEDAARAGARKAAVTRDFSDLAQVIENVNAHLPNLGFLSSAQVDVTAPSDQSDDFTEHLMVGVRVNAVYRFTFLGAIGIPDLKIERSTWVRYEWQTAGTTAVVDPSSGEITNTTSAVIDFDLS